MNDDSQVAEAWNGWSLVKDFSWGYFVTLTFPLTESRDGAAKAWRVFSSKLAQVNGLSANQARRTGLPWIRSIEQHGNGSSHIHALISGATSKSISDTWTKLISKGAKISISPFDKTRYAIGYLAKENDVEVSNYFLKA